MKYTTLGEFLYIYFQVYNQYIQSTKHLDYYKGPFEHFKCFIHLIPIFTENLMQML